MKPSRLSSYAPPRRRQLQISERRILLMVGDTVAILIAVLLSLAIWVTVESVRSR